MTQVLTAHLWQSTFFGLAAALVTAAFRGNRAQVRYWLWLSASLKFLVPFALLLSLGGFLQTRMPAASQAASRIAAPAVAWTAEEFTRPTFSGGLAQTSSAPDMVYRIPVALFAIWLAGFATVASTRFRGWLKLRAAVRASHAVGVSETVRIHMVRGRLEPGVVGIARPVLLLPEGIAERLTPPELEAVVAHELCHVRRRDNFFAAIHMIVEAIFWFHPLVWWIGARLIEERERACDEEVVIRGSHPEVYADAILNVCKLYAQSPVMCVSGVSGANIRRRIEAILSDRSFERLSRAKKLLLAGAGTAALAGPVAVGFLMAHAPAIRAQSSESTKISFEVASVKRVTGTPAANLRTTVPPTIYPGGRFVAKYYLYPLVAYAYNVPVNRLSGIPNTMGENVYDIEATGTIPAGLSVQARKDQIRMMLQTLLADRFKMAIHKETKEMPVYALVVARGGPKLKKADIEEKDCPDGPTAPFPQGSSTPDPETCHAFYGGQGRGLHSRAVTMADLVSFVGTWTDRPLLDKTGIEGLFHIETLPWQRMDAAQTIDGVPSQLPTLFQVFADLGLRMEARNGNADVYVVDHIEEPSAN
jgi:uncharacterized protein (TIGR03435 family)